MAAIPRAYRSLSRIATAIPQSTRTKLANEHWRVHAKDEVTQNAVMEYLARSGRTAEVIPFARGGETIPGIPVSFEIVEYLKKNETRVPYSFDAYHRERSTVPWRLWLKGEKAVGQILGAAFVGKHPRPFAEKKGA